MSLVGNAENNVSLKVLRGKIVTIPHVDDTLSKSGYAADAKVTGEKLKEVKEEVKHFTVPAGSSVSYDNEGSGLEAETVQEAIDEVKKKTDESFSKSGGIINGNVSVKTTDNGYGTLKKNHSADVDYGTQVVDTDKNGNTAHVDVSALYGTVSFTASDNVPYQMFHEGVKGFNDYIGNGSATQRVIDTKGIGRLLLVYNTSYFSFVTPEGALVIKLSDGSISWIDCGKVFYVNGKLNIINTNAAFNESGTTYHYQVI